MVDCKSVQKYIEDTLQSDDVISRPLVTGGADAVLVYLDALSDKLLLEQNVIAQLLDATSPPITADELNNVLTYGEAAEPLSDDDKVIAAAAEGDVVLCVQGAETCFKISLKKFEHRAVAEPPTETVIKGPREGFNEEIKTNVALIRRRLKTPSLRVKQFKIGRYSNTTVCMIYIDGVAEQSVVDDVSEKIQKIDIDGVVGSAYVERFVEKYSRSIFNQAGVTEKPDIVTAKLLEGRVAIVADGSPVVITVPFILMESFQDSYDYYIRDSRSTMLRALRVLGAGMAVILPGMYVAIQEYHYHLLPLKFLISILNGVAGIPFTPPMEMLFVLLLFEVLYQASVRMPRYVGTALSIVGAIVLGETAVNAGLLSSPTVLIIAISAIGINCMPDLVDTFSILRLSLLLIGSVLGLFGVILFSVFVLAYLCGMQSFGSPYLAPFAPLIAPDLKDALIKDNLIDMEKRPYAVPTDNRRRMKNGD